MEKDGHYGNQGLREGGGKGFISNIQEEF